MSAPTPLVARREIDAIELTIFADLLTRISRYRSLDGYAYGAMSGFAMDDQLKLYRTFGARPMLAFDERAEVVARQRFNRPTMRSRVSISTFEHFAAEWPQMFVDEGFEGSANHILWVRRDTADDVGRSVRYFQQMVGNLAEGGIARITLRIDYDLWAGPTHLDGKRRLASDRRKHAAERVVNELGEFLDEEELAAEIDDEGLYRSLATAFGAAAANGVGGATGRTFEPLSLIRYGAGPVDLTLTGMVVDTADRGRLRECVEEGGCPFVSRVWSDIENVRLPDVTHRERLELEACAGDRFAARKRLHFDLDEATLQEGVFEDFRRFHRYLPTMIAADL